MKARWFNGFGLGLSLAIQHVSFASPSADFNGDGFDDLAIGAPGESRSGRSHAGAVHVLYGSGAGFSGSNSQLWDQDRPGIADKDLPHIFDRFYRSSESRSMPGSGLGLSIVRQIAVSHSGRVQAVRSPNGGARLTLRLPGRVSPD